MAVTVCQPALPIAGLIAGCNDFLAERFQGAIFA